MNMGRKPALVQWKLPLGHAAVPAKKIISSKQKQLVRIALGKSMSVSRVARTHAFNTHRVRLSHRGSHSSHHSPCRREWSGNRPGK